MLHVFVSVCVFVCVCVRVCVCVCVGTVKRQQPSLEGGGAGGQGGVTDAFTWIQQAVSCQPVGYFFIFYFFSCRFFCLRGGALWWTEKRSERRKWKKKYRVFLFFSQEKAVLFPLEQAVYG